MLKLKPEVKAKWIAALTSGEYKQGRNWLRTSEDGFCCLGVLCDLYAKEHPGFAEWGRPSMGRVEFKTVDNYRGLNYSGQYAPGAVLEWAHVEPIDPADREASFDTVNNAELWVISGGQSVKMSFPGMNDQLEMSFAAIAEVIKEKL